MGTLVRVYTNLKLDHQVKHNMYAVDVHIYENYQESLKHEINTKYLSLQIFLHYESPPGNNQLPTLIWELVFRQTPSHLFWEKFPTNTIYLSGGLPFVAEVCGYYNAIIQNWKYRTIQTNLILVVIVIFIFYSK